MAQLTRLFYPTTVTKVVGEGGISTGLSPLDWSPLGPTVAGGSSDVNGTRITRTGAFATYTFVSGDQLVVVSGSAGTTTGTYTISGKVSDNAIDITASLGASKTSIVAYIIRSSLAGAILDYPTALPGDDLPPSLAFDNFASIRPQDASLLQATKILQLGGWKLVGDTKTIATVMSEDLPTSIESVGLGFRFMDANYDGTGSAYTTRIQLRTATDGPFGSTVDYFGSNGVVDGGGGTSGINYQYVQPGTFDGSLAATSAQLADTLKVNFQVQQSAGDAIDSCSLLSFNGFLLKVVENVGGFSGGRTLIRMPDGRIAAAKSRTRGRFSI